MDLGKEQEQDWERSFGKAREFLAGFRLTSSVVTEEEKPFYDALTGLLATAMERDRFVAAVLPEEERSDTESGTYIKYRTLEEGKENETSFFLTTLEEWAKTVPAPRLEGFQTKTGRRYIEISRTSAGGTRFDNAPLADRPFISIRAYDNGLVVGKKASGESEQLAHDDLQVLTESFLESRDVVLENLSLYSKKSSDT